MHVHVPHFSSHLHSDHSAIGHGYGFGWGSKQSGASRSQTIMRVWERVQPLDEGGSRSPLRHKQVSTSIDYRSMVPARPLEDQPIHRVRRSRRSVGRVSMGLLASSRRIWRVLYTQIIQYSPNFNFVYMYTEGMLCSTLIELESRYLSWGLVSWELAMFGLRRTRDVSDGDSFKGWDNLWKGQVDVCWQQCVGEGDCWHLHL